MSKEELVTLIKAEIEKLKGMREKAERIEDFTALAKEIRVYYQTMAEILGFLNRFPEVNIKTSKVLEGGVYGNN